MLLKIVDKLPVDFYSLMWLQMQIVKDKLEVFDEGNEWGCFLFLVHGLEWTWDDPFLDLVVSDALEDKRVELDQKDRWDLDGLDAFKDFKHFIAIDQRGKVHHQMQKLFNSFS